MPLLGPGSAQQRYASQRVRDTRVLLVDAEDGLVPRTQRSVT
ncbi:hypothetical protein ABIA95_002603 [Bradyrhizobium sp. LA8.1]